MSAVDIFRTSGRIVFGSGALARIADEVKAAGGKKVAIITDPGLVKTGLVEKLEKFLSAAKVPFVRYDKVEADPRYEIVYDALDVVKKSKADVVIGFGGGSSQDIAKAAAMLARNEGPVERYFGTDLVPKPGLPLILIPTTAGTGSEVTPIAILSDSHEKLKKGIVSPYLFPAVALLDPELTLGLPPAITAATGMDALIHAVEAYTSIHATPLSDLLAIEAIRLISANLRTAYASGGNLGSREAMLRGSLLAGMAFATAGVTAVHAFAYPIGAEFHIPHGVANTIMFIPVMEFNFLGNLPRFAALAEFLGENSCGMTQRESAMLALESIKTLAQDLNVPQHLKEFGVKKSDVPALAKAVLLVTRLLSNNPRRVGYEDAVAIYTKAL
ncbi:MAG: iron-containing alcohol dehydrogenase [Betaproteobacteria bacterium]|nr:iron-containing alcohol dehydrogenase [Betaproteobacteria bacterium]